MKRKDKSTFLSFVSQLQVFPFDRNASIEASETFRHGKKQGKLISHPDAVIAGTYKTNYVNSIITRNKNHFENIPKLRVVTY